MYKSKPYFNAAENRASALQWLERLRKDPLTTQFEENLKHFNEYVTKGNLTLASLGTNEEEIHRLRVEKHMLAAMKEIGYIDACLDKNSPIAQLHKEELEKEKAAGNFTIEQLREAMPNKRKSDTPNPQKKRKMPPLPPANSPEFKVVQQRVLAYKEKALLTLEKLRNEELTLVKYACYMRDLRDAMKAGFTDEDLQGDVFFSPEELYTTREELDELDPHRKYWRGIV